MLTTIGHLSRVTTSFLAMFGKHSVTKADDGAKLISIQLGEMYAVQTAIIISSKLTISHFSV